MTITLSEELARWATERAARLGYGSPQEYIEDMIEEDRTEAEASRSTAPPEELAAARRRFSDLVKEGLACEDWIEVTPEFWEERHRELQRRLAARRLDAAS